MGRFVHFEPFQIAPHSTQFFNSLSSGGIRSKFGRRNFGGAWGPILAAGVVTAAVTTEAWAAAAAVTLPLSTGMPTLPSCVRERSIFACAGVTVSVMLAHRD